MSNTLSLEMLQNLGAFTGAPVAKEITWTDLNTGSTAEATVYVRQASYETVTEQWKASNEQKDGTAARIANMIVDEAGKPIFTIETIKGDGERGALSESLTVALLNAIGEVNKVHVPEADGDEPK